MAVIIREERIIGGKRFPNTKVYKSDKLALTGDAKKQAEQLDEYLSRHLRIIEREARAKGLMGLKGRGGALKLWYFVGSKLQFVDNPKIVLPEDKKYIWRAIWDHAGKLAPGVMNKRTGTHRDHFFYCYRVAKYEWSRVERGGNWRAWVEFLDSPKINTDPRILDWVGVKMIDVQEKNWIRVINRGLRQELRGKDTSFLNNEELYQFLERVWSNTYKKEGDN